MEPALISVATTTLVEGRMLPRGQVREVLSAASAGGAVVAGPHTPDRPARRVAQADRGGETGAAGSVGRQVEP